MNQIIFLRNFYTIPLLWKEAIRKFPRTQWLHFSDLERSLHCRQLLVVARQVLTLQYLEQTTSRLL